MRAILVVVILACALPIVMALPYDVSITEMYRHGMYWPPKTIEFGALKNFDKVVFMPCIAHHHSAGNALSFTLLNNGTKVYEAAWSRVAVGECPAPEFDVSLGNTLADNFTWGGYIGSRSWGFFYFEVRMPPVKKYGAIPRDMEAMDLGEVGVITNSAPGSNAFRISTELPNVFVFFDDSTGERKDITYEKDARAMVCPDTNNNSKCDYDETSFKTCTDAGGDWFRDYCCGTNVTSCQYVGNIPINTTRECIKRNSFGICTEYANVVHNSTINAICGNNSRGEWQWVPAEDIGEINEMKCPDASIVPDGNSFFACGTPFDSITQPFGEFRNIRIGSANHEYSCNNKMVFECGGKEGPFSTINGVLMGGTNPGLSETYYCASDGDWTTDLDGKDNTSCYAAGFSWTGSLCCSEADDPAEYYNDKSPNSVGGCWNSQFIQSGEFVMNDPRVEEDRVINYNGSFYGCNITINSLLALRDTHAPSEPVIDNSRGICGYFLFNARPGEPYPHALCYTRTGFWERTEELAGTIIKEIAWPNLVNLSLPGISSQGCCGFDQCWNGTQCQSLNSFYRILDDGFMCQMPEVTILPPGPSVECERNDDCDEGEECTYNVCVPENCDSDTPCPPGFSCRFRNCRPE